MLHPGFRLFAASAFTSFISTFVMGYQMSAFNQPVDVFQRYINSSAHHIHGGYINSHLLSGLWAFIVSTFVLGQFFGSISMPYFSERFGRKPSLMIHSNVIIIIGTLCLVLAKPTDVFELLILGRFILGFSSGLSAALLAVYLSECSPDEYRGVIGNMQNLFITTATFIGTFLALDVALGSDELWPYLLSIPGFLALVQIATSPLFPESPKFLYIERNDRVAAERAILFYHGPSEDTAHVLETYEAERQLQKQQLGFVSILQNRHLKWSALLSFTVPAAAMLTGIMAIFSYSTEIFTSIHISKSASEWTTVITSGCNLIGGFLAIPLLRRMSRRSLVLGGTFVICGTNALFILANQFGKRADIEWLNYVAVACVIATVTIYNMSIGPLSFLYGAEISPQAARSICGSITLMSNSLFALFQNLALPPLLDSIGSFVFLILIVPSIILGLFHLKYMPETKDKSVDEILKGWWHQQDIADGTEDETEGLLDAEDA